MPWNITSPNNVEFVFQPKDASGVPTYPSSASITLEYFIGGILNSSTADMTPLGNGWFTYTWRSFGVDVPSDVDFEVISQLSSPFTAVTGELRIIDP